MIKDLIIKFIMARLKEPSTWRGIVVLITGAGIKLAPQWQASIITLGLILFGSASAFPDQIGGKSGTGTTGTRQEDAGGVVGPQGIGKQGD